MGALTKLLVGIVFIVLGAWLISPFWLVSKPAYFDWFHPTMTVLKGIVPLLLIFVGLLVVWIETEEMKTPNLEDEMKDKQKTLTEKK